MRVLSELRFSHSLKLRDMDVERDKPRLRLKPLKFRCVMFRIEVHGELLLTRAGSLNFPCII